MELASALQLIKHKSLLVNYKTEWADLGCGDGLFTTALAQLLQPGSTIYAVDKNRTALNQFPTIINEVTIATKTADFTKESFHLAGLDGVIMANSLHFVKDKISLIRRVQEWLKQEGVLLIVEYDTNNPNPWVPYPISFSSLTGFFKELNLYTAKISERPSIYNRASIYSALIYR